MTKEIIETTKKSFEETLSYFASELGKLRASRAQSSLVEDISVDYYGSKTRIKELATIITPSPQIIQIEPWDKNSVEGIRKALEGSALGLTPIVDGSLIRLTLPMLSEERRNDLKKVVIAKAEEARISMRQKRDEAWKKIQEHERIHKISEDEKFRAKDELQHLVETYHAKIKALEEQKEKEIMGFV